VKRIAIIGVLALFAMLLVSSLTVTAIVPPTPERKMVTVGSAYADQSLVGNFTAVRYHEGDIGVPMVNGFWTVADSIQVTNNLGYNLTNIVLNLTYPSNWASKPVAHIDIPFLNDTLQTYVFVEYQKKAPYYNKTNDVDANVITVHGYENLTGVGWKFDPTTITSFSALTSTVDLTIKKNGHTLEQGTVSNHKDWYWNADGVIVFEGLSVVKGDANAFNFIWTAPTTTTPVTVPSTTAPVQPWYMQTQGGFPVWLIIAVIVIVVALVFLASGGKKR